MASGESEMWHVTGLKLKKQPKKWEEETVQRRKDNATWGADKTFLFDLCADASNLIVQYFTVR